MTLYYEVVVESRVLRKKATCQTCRYYLDVAAARGDGLEAPGECHANSPRLVSGTVRTWPSVRSDDWCARHNPEEDM